MGETVLQKVASGQLHPEQWVEQHGDVLYRFALTRVRNPTVAEDVVQETLVSALRSQATFSGRSTERTWLVGILKHKIIDHFRTSNRERPVEQVEDWPQAVETPFDESGGWRVKDGEGPMDWGADVSSAVERKEFQQVLSRCLERLPPRTAEVFTLREMEELGTAAICKLLGVSATTVWVMLHRARMQLRRCLERHWFGLAAAKRS
jgi:RNA polymerase sigma-70 factor (ECF subfamily)